ncbi:MAG: PepSY domain-containing protein [Thiotrichales bacterium]
MIKPVLFSLLMSLGVPAVNADTEAQTEPPITRQQVITIVSDKFGGRVLEITTEAPGGQNLDVRYRVKMLNQGRVRVFHVDGSTGEVK